jgi:hypothetical protein
VSYLREGRWVVRPYLAALAAAALLGGCEETPVSSGGDSPCQTVLDYHGHRYVRHGELRRDPTTTGRVDSGTMPACDDGNGAEPARQVQVAELADVSQRRAVLVEGTLYVRTDLPFPEVARIWFVSPRCSTGGWFELDDDRLSVAGAPRPRFDGDLRPPYRLGVHVTHGPRKYLGTTIRIQVTRRTHPSLGPEDVKTSLWQGGGLNARIRWFKHAFEATSITSRPD